MTGTPVAEYVPDRLVRGRVALVGDAAHVTDPMTGRGSAEALRDAKSLAAATGRPRTDADPAEALLDHERDRPDVVRDMVLPGRRA